MRMCYAGREAKQTDRGESNGSRGAHQTVTAIRHAAGMSEISAPAPVTGRWTMRKLAHPATLMLLATNAIPPIGLVFWRWDAFVLLLGYWAETAVIAVLAAFVSRGVTCLLDLLGAVPIRRWILAIWPDYPGALPANRKPDPGAVLFGLGGRIILMQVAVLVGGFIAVKLEMVAPVVLPLLILIAIKSYIELSLHIADWPNAAK